MVRLCREFHARIHIVHLAAAEGLPMLRAARAEGLPITVETCPHYLTFCGEEIADGATLFKCAPPIRGRDNRDALWRALEDGDIDFIATDHSPCPPSMKADGDFLRAWGGVASLELSLAAVWTVASARGIPVNASSAGCRPLPRAWQGSRAAKDRSPSARTRTSSSGIPMPAWSSTKLGYTSGTSAPGTPAAACAAASSKPTSAVDSCIVSNAVPARVLFRPARRRPRTAAAPRRARLRAGVQRGAPPPGF